MTTIKTAKRLRVTYTFRAPPRLDMKKSYLVDLELRGFWFLKRWYVVDSTDPDYPVGRVFRLFPIKRLHNYSVNTPKVFSDGFFDVSLKAIEVLK